LDLVRVEKETKAIAKRTSVSPQRLRDSAR
jgi:hypothetical protein